MRRFVSEGPEANVKTVDSRSKRRNRKFFLGSPLAFPAFVAFKKQGCGIFHRKKKTFGNDIVSLERRSLAILAANWGRRVRQGRSYDLATHTDI